MVSTTGLPTGTDSTTVEIINAYTGRKAHLTGTAVLGTQSRFEFPSQDYLEVIATPGFDRDDVEVFSTWKPEWAQRVYGRSGNSKTRLDYPGSFQIGTIKFNNGEPINFTQPSPNGPKFESKYSETVPLSFRVTVKTPKETEPVIVTVPIEVSMTSVLGDIKLKFPGKQNTIKVNLPGQNDSPIHLQLLGVESEDYPGINDEGETEFSVSTNKSKEFKVIGRLFTESDPITTESNRITGKKPVEVRIEPNDATTIQADFKPNFDLTVAQAAELSGFKNFNWYQVVTYDDTKAFEVPWTDPPRYVLIGDSGAFKRYWADGYPFYWNQKHIDTDQPPSYFLYQVTENLNDYWSAKISTDQKTFAFNDSPQQVKSPLADPKRPSLEKHFETFLVGVRKDYEYLADALYKFSWESDNTLTTYLSTGFTGTTTSAGGIKNIKDLPIDPNKRFLGAFYASDITRNQDGTVTLNNSGWDSFKNSTEVLPIPIIASDSTTLASFVRDLLLTGNKAINGTGNALNNTIIGNSENNILDGQEGDDILIGGSGNDSLLGGLGEDILVGGKGADNLGGGKGRDKFVFSGVNQQTALTTSTLRNPDKIIDFKIREGDKIQLDFDGNLSTSNMPKSLFYAGEFKGNLKQALKLVYADRDRKRGGGQLLMPNQAAIFKVGKLTFLSVNDSNKKFSVSNDLLVNLAGSVLSHKAGDFTTLPVVNYFV